MSHGLSSVRRLVAKHPLAAVLYSVASNQAARLMHSFINFQGQVLHLAQGDTCHYNYVDNFIAFTAKGQGFLLGEGPHGSEELDPDLRLEFAQGPDC